MIEQRFRIIETDKRQILFIKQCDNDGDPAIMIQFFLNDRKQPDYIQHSFETEAVRDALFNNPVEAVNTMELERIFEQWEQIAKDVDTDSIDDDKQEVGFVKTIPRDIATDSIDFEKRHEINSERNASGGGC